MLGDSDPFEKCATMGAVLREFSSIAQRMGVRRCAIVAPPPFHATVGPATLVFSWGFDEAWVNQYLTNRSIDDERTADKILELGRPALWRDIQARSKLSDKHYDLAETFFRVHGNDGVALPLFGPFGHQVFLSLSFNTPVDDILDPRISLISRIGSMCHRRYIEIFRQENLPKNPLSMREKQVLAQIAGGQSKKQAARNLGLSTSSIDTYQRRIFFKLAVDDRTEAAVKGLSLGLIKL